MNDLITALKTRLEAAVALHEFTTPAGAKAVPSVYVGDTPFHGDSGNVSSVPYVLIRLTGGIDDRSERLLTVQLLAAVWNDDPADGIEDINTLTLQLLSLQRLRGFTPYKLMMPVKWSSGDEQGNHQHPFYFANVTYQFKAPPLADVKI